MNSKAIKRQLLAAIAMVLVAAIALGSSTYAWFVASGSVEAKGMKVQAQAESGLLIRGVQYDSESKKWLGNTWATSANAYSTDMVDLHPTSTINLTNWVKASSNAVNTALAGQDAGEYSPVDETLLNTYRRLDTFAIRSASGADLTNTKLAISSVTASTTGKTTTDLNSSIRVGVRMHESSSRALISGESGSTLYIFAPNITGEKFTLTAKYSGGSTLDEYKTASNTRDFLYIKDDKIPYADTGVMVEIFTWYEGEDEACKTENITNDAGAALDADDLSISVVFEKVAIPTTQAGSGGSSGQESGGQSG